MTKELQSKQLLQWYITAGADEAIGNTVVNRFERDQKPELMPETLPQSTSVIFAQAENSALLTASGIQPKALADEASSLEELKEILFNFNESPLKTTATNMVFGSGNPRARLMIIGEAPGAEEDKQGLPFVGPSGHLLDQMLKSIGLNRADVYISNILPWRPPGNRKPSESEIALFTPFIRKHIALITPKILLLLGGSAVSALFHTNAGITKMRGHWLTYTDEKLTIDVMASFHPAFLLRTPVQKRLSWRDFLAVRKKLDE